MLFLYNTLSHRKEEFKPISGKSVGMYACGITAYYSPHIGNMRTYIQEDLFRRLLEHEGYEVKHVQNITDVGHLVSDADTGEDKLRLEAEKEHKTMKGIAEFYTKMFLDDMDRLNILRPQAMPRATDHIDEMLRLIQTLDEKGFLYKAEGGMYYDTSKFSDYGQLTGMTFERLVAELKEGVRVGKVEGKRNPTDFVVWRFAHGDEKEMIWDTKWGKGFPGWHIECSAMSMKYLGEHFDIHFGGVDHIPIHHTNEIAQSEAATGKKFVNYWVHMQFLTIDGSKMSKSLKNIYTVQDVLDKGHNPMALRLLLMSGNYRQVLNFTFDALSNAQKTLNGVYSFLERVSETRKSGKSAGQESDAFKEGIRKSKEAFFGELRDDMNMPEALAAMHGIISATNQRADSGATGAEEAGIVLDAMGEIDQVLGLKFKEHMQGANAPVDKEIERLIGERESARLSKDFKKSDEVRKLLKEKYHIILEDTKEGVRWHAE